MPSNNSYKAQDIDSQCRIEFARDVDSVFNSFNAARYQGNDQPDSRSLHTSFLEKWVDSYFVLAGGTDIFDWPAMIKFMTKLLKTVKKGKEPNFNAITSPFFIVNLIIQRPKPGRTFGLFDYATLGIFYFAPLICANMLAVLKTDTKNLPLFPKTIARGIKVSIFLPFLIMGALHILGNGLIRSNLCGAINLLALTPIIGIAHGITQAVRWWKGRKLNSVDVEPITQVNVSTMEEIPPAEIANNKPLQEVINPMHRVTHIFAKRKDKEIFTSTDENGKKFKSLTVTFYNTEKKPGKFDAPVAKKLFTSQDSVFKLFAKVNPHVRNATKDASKKHEMQPRWMRKI